MHPTKLSVPKPIVIIALLLSFLLMASHLIPLIDGKDQQLPKAQRGIMDLSDWNFEDSGNVELSGEWAFLPNQLIDFEEWSTYELDQTLLQVPATWNTAIHPDQAKAIGVGTYRLHVILPASHKGTITNYGYRTQNIRTSHTVLIQEAEAPTGGYQLDFSHHATHNVPYASSFSVLGDSIDIIVQVSNYDHASSGGIVRPILLGTSFDIFHEDKMSTVIGVVLATIALLHSIIAGILYMGRRDQKHLLYFSLLHAFASIYVLTTGERLLFQLFPEVSQSAGYKLIQFSFYAYFYYCYIFLSRLYPEFSHPLVHRLIQIGTVTSILTVLFLDNALITSHDNYRVIAISLLSAYMLYHIIRALFAHKEDAAYLLLLGTAMLSYGMPDILLAFNIDYRRPPIDQAVILLSMMMLAVNRFVQTTRQVEQLRLQRAHMETALLQAQIKPHFLFNALNTIGSLVESDPPRAQDLIAEFSNYLRFSFDLSDLELLVPFKREWSLVEAYLQLEQARYEELLQVHADIAAADDIMLPPLTLQPLVENAIRHGLMRREEGGSITIRAKREGPAVTISISDDGVGIPSELVERLCAEPLGKADRNDMSGAGIGVYNINHRLQSSFGQGLMITSREGEGTTVSFQVRIPSVHPL